LNQKLVISRLTERLNNDLCQAAIYYEVFEPSALHAALLDRVNNQRIHEAFNVISEALELGVLTALCRIWDKARGTARIAEVMKRLEKVPDLTPDKSEFARLKADVDTFLKSDSLAALRAFRNVGLAHSNDPNLPDLRAASNTRRVLHGDARIVMEGTIPIIERLNNLAGLDYESSFTQVRVRWKQKADKFWNNVARS
jgi:hypothetical protein